jgi:alkylation response protein AidB-like acyl-CoA dehydrogenase
MRLTLTEDQALIQSSAMDWLADRYDFRQREASVHRDGGAKDVWRAFAEMGWLGLPLPEAHGGLGMGPMEAGLLMQAFGRHLVVEPWHACVLQAGRLLSLAGAAAQQSEWLPGSVSGEARLSLAHMEPGDRLPWEPRRTMAVRDAAGWTLTGEKRQVIAAPGAARWIVSAQAQGGTQLFLVRPSAAGVQLDAYDTVSGGRAADIRLSRVPAELLGTPDAAGAQGAQGAGSPEAKLRQVLAEGLVGLGWEAVGAMQAALAQTTDYTQQRRQFGQSLSQFQVVQHRLAEMAVHCAEAQAVCELVSMRLALAPSEGPALAALVKTKVGSAARFVAQEAVQLHGAMGVCEELPIAATFRLLLAFRQQGGQGSDHAAARGIALWRSGGFGRSQTLTEAGHEAVETCA